MKRRVSVLLGCVLFSMASQAQEKVLKEIQAANIWCDGSILLNDGSELKGLLRYDDKNSIVNFQDGDNARSFTARSVAGFEFSDAISNKQRIFYSLEYEDPLNNAVQPLFFELLRDFQTFAIISKIDPVAVSEK